MINNSQYCLVSTDKIAFFYCWNIYKDTADWIISSIFCYLNEHLKYVNTKSVNGDADFVYFLPWCLSGKKLNFRPVGSTHSFNI